MADDDLFLGGGSVFKYVIASHEFPSAAVPRSSISVEGHVQIVPQGTDPYSIAGKAATWLGKNGRTLNELIIVGHGKPGQMMVGTWMNAKTIVPLGGWLSTFFEKDAKGITLHGCNAAADSTIPWDRGWRGTFDKNHPGTGYDLMRALAKISGQTVRAGIDVQVLDPNYALDGIFLEVRPNGTFRLFT